MDQNIIDLLTCDQPSTNKEINDLKTILKKYIASPWVGKLKTVISPREYNEIMTKYIQQFPENQGQLSCSDNKANEYQDILCQSHAGNLYQHVQWSALQVIKWHMEDNEIMDSFRGIDDLNTCIVATFFHDVGKAGDCIYSCNERECWYDMYNADKYNKQGDWDHPNRCGDVILGLQPFFKTCDGTTGTSELKIPNLLHNCFPNVNQRVVALAAYMHWEFGKLNIPDSKKKLHDKIKTYLETFKISCKRCQISPSVELLKLCILVACADITAGTNVRLLHEIHGIAPCPRSYIGKDPWVAYGMDKKYLQYRQAVLDAYTRPSNNGGRMTRRSHSD